jgi:cytochrome c-type protein NapB
MAPYKTAPGKTHVRATSIVLIVVVTASVSGFFMGLRETVSDTENVHVITTEYVETHGTSFDHDPSAVTGAVTYSQLSEVRRGPNATWENSFSKLNSNIDDLPSDVDVEAQRASRKARRAYEGAPPVVPHPVVQTDSTSCLLCHQEATRIGDRIAPAVSHRAYTSCTQCHVADSGLPIKWNTGRFAMDSNSEFKGEHTTSSGIRAYEGAPPTIPHRTLMRENCMSCHGEGGTSAIRTSHPDRQSCTQCHAPDAGYDQREFLKTTFP